MNLKGCLNAESTILRAHSNSKKNIYVLVFGKEGK